jgi:hypothetical protein
VSPVPVYGTRNLFASSPELLTVYRNASAAFPHVRFLPDDGSDQEIRLLEDMR